MERTFPCFKFLSVELRILFAKIKRAAPHPTSPIPFGKPHWMDGRGTRNPRSGQYWCCLKSPGNKHAGRSQMVKMHFYNVLCGLIISMSGFSHLYTIRAAFARHLRKLTELPLAFSVAALEACLICLRPLSHLSFVLAPGLQ